MCKKCLATVLSLMMVLSFLPTLGILNVSSKVSAAGNVIIDATVYGADPSGKKDSAEAIWAAFVAAKKATTDGATSVTVNFPKGEYHIYKDYSQKRGYHTSNTHSMQNPIKTIGILIEEQQNLTVEGNESLFMMHGNMMALAVVKSQNVKLHNFAWDFAVPTVSEFTVVGLGTEAGKNYTDYYIPQNFRYVIDGTTFKWQGDISPYTGNPYWERTGIHNAYGIVTHLPNEEMTRIYGTGGNTNPFNNVVSITQKENNIIRIVYNGARGDDQKLGNIFEFAGSAHRETAGAFIWESSDTVVEKVNVHYLDAFGWLTQMSHNVTYRQCNFMPREGTGRVTVGFADGIHASGASGKFLIEDCNFSNTHDDPINMHGTFTRVNERVNDHTLKLNYIHYQQGGFPQYHVGDQVQFFTRDTLESTDGETIYTVKRIVANPGENGYGLQAMEIEFDQVLPTTLSDVVSGEPKYVCENITYAPSVTIRGCTFKNIATRAILCTTRNPVVIENNTIFATSMPSTFLSNDSNLYYESGPIRNFTFRNNTVFVKSIGGETSWAYSPGILIEPVTKNNGLPSWENPIHKNITVEGNTFYMSNHMVLKANSVENLTIKNNKIIRTNPDISMAITASKTDLNVGETVTLGSTNTGAQRSGRRENVYGFRACKNVVITGNTYDDGLKLNAVNFGNMPNEQIHITNDEVVIRADENGPTQPGIKNVKYGSSDPRIVTVNDAGVVTAVAPGTANVYSYYEYDRSTLRSNTIAITVAGATTITPAVDPGSQSVAVAEKIEVTGMDAPFVQNSPTEKAYFAITGTNNANTVTIKVTKSEQTGSVKLLYGHYRREIPMVANGNEYTAQVPLYTGLNSFFVSPTGKDGIYKKQYILNLVRMSSGNANASAIKLGSTGVTGFAPDTVEYNVNINEGALTDGKIMLESATADSRATACITANNVRYDGKSKLIPLNVGLNDVDVCVKADNMVTVKHYTLNIVVASRSNAKLLSIVPQNARILPAFNQNVTAYSLSTSNDTLNLTATAQETEADVKILCNGKSATAKSTATLVAKLYKGVNDIQITVTAPDGTTQKIYTVSATLLEYKYLSDLNWTSATTGWNTYPATKDAHYTGVKLSLTNDAGEKVTYDKGIGSHADSTIIYDIAANSGYNKFEAYVGIDKTGGSSASSVTYQVYINDNATPIYTSGEMTLNTPQKFISIDMTGVTKLKLVAVKGTNNDSDHIVWGDAKFTNTVSERPMRYDFNGSKVVDLEDALYSLKLATGVKIATDNDFAIANTDNIIGTLVGAILNMAIGKV